MEKGLSDDVHFPLFVCQQSRKFLCVNRGWSHRFRWDLTCSHLCRQGHQRTYYCCRMLGIGKMTHSYGDEFGKFLHIMSGYLNVFGSTMGGMRPTLTWILILSSRLIDCILALYANATRCLIILLPVIIDSYSSSTSGSY
jgi:hypothetical protein